MLAPLLIAAVVGYLLGALPFGYLVARAKGVNIFEVGSKNPGATNVRRVLGAGPGNLVFALDALKGAGAVGWPLLLARWLTVYRALYFVSGYKVTLDSQEGQMIVGLVAALIGHSFSCFTRFRGGKGVATACGGMLVLVPLSALIAAAVWAAAFFAFRYVSLASILAAVALPISAWALGRPISLIVISALVAGFVIVRHRGNITRLLNGTENKFKK
jgi:acyl phosphate:glycerol-3-phosphate acyltransferase